MQEKRKRGGGERERERERELRGGGEELKRGRGRESENWKMAVSLYYHQVSVFCPVLNESKCRKLTVGETKRIGGIFGEIKCRPAEPDAGEFKRTQPRGSKTERTEPAFDETKSTRTSSRDK